MQSQYPKTLKNPLILAIDTATSHCSVALGIPGEEIHEVNQQTERRHNEILPDLISSLFQKSGSNWKNLDAIAVSIGPGSFTGLRVGVSFAKGAALGLGVPLIPVETLDALAESVLSLRPEVERLCCMVSARRGEAFGRMFRKTENSIRQEGEVRLLTPFQAKKLAEEGVLLCGEGAVRLLEEADLNDPEIVTPLHVLSSAKMIINLAAVEIRRSGGVFPSISDIEPMYLKEFTVTQRKQISS
jgi:tRNA threonylcarbamoyladenosine biosynthesis protein TsaB